MYLHTSRRSSKPRGKTNRRNAARKAKKAKRRVNGMQGRKLGVRWTKR